MKGLVTGIFLGVGIGLLLAPQRGEETRRILNQRWQELRENELVKQYLPAFSGDLSQTLSGLGDLAQFAFGRVKANDATLTGLARLAVDKMMNYQVSLNDLARFATMMRKKAR
jgi:gas vesicle protein